MCLINNQNESYTLSIEGGKIAFAQWLYNNTHYVALQDETHGLTTVGIYMSNDIKNYQRISSIDMLSGIAYRDYCWSTSNGVFFLRWSDDGGDGKAYYSVDSGINWFCNTNKISGGWVSFVPLIEYNYYLYYLEHLRQNNINDLCIKRVRIDEFKEKYFEDGELVLDITNYYNDLPTVDTDMIWFAVVIKNFLYVYCKGVTYKISENEASILAIEDTNLCYSEFEFLHLPIVYNQKAYFSTYNSIYKFDGNSYTKLYKPQNDKKMFQSHIKEIFCLCNRLFFKTFDNRLFEIKDDCEFILIDEDCSSYLGSCPIEYHSHSRNLCISNGNSIKVFPLEYIFQPQI